MSLPHEQSQKSGVKPMETVPFQPGATNSRDNAIQYRNNQISQQQRINGTGGKKIRKNKQKGGVLVVPQFSQSGPQVSSASQDANSNSRATNIAHTQALANGTCDNCIGTNSNTPHCQSATCNPATQSGGSSCNGSGLVTIGKTWGCMSGGNKTKRKSLCSGKKIKYPNKYIKINYCKVASGKKRSFCRKKRNSTKKITKTNKKHKKSHKTQRK